MEINTGDSISSHARFFRMKICSLLPSATEILFALGLGEQIVGVSHECDFPPEARQKTVLIRPCIAPGSDAARIEKQVRELAVRGESIYQVDAEAPAALDPDLIVTQDLCHVCAPTPNDVKAALAILPRQPRVLSLYPHSLDEVCADIRKVGEATGCAGRAEAVVEEFQKTVAAVEGAVAGLPARRIACLEWLDLPYIAGHWFPKMAARAGGIDVLGRAGKPSFRAEWEQILDTRSEVIVIMPCGNNVELARREFQTIKLPSGWNQIPAVQDGAVFLADASGHFSRPGPPLATGVAILARALHSNESLDFPPPGPDLLARASV